MTLDNELSDEQVAAFALVAHAREAEQFPMEMEKLRRLYAIALSTARVFAQGNAYPDPEERVREVALRVSQRVGRWTAA